MSQQEILCRDIEVKEQYKRNDDKEIHVTT